MKTQSKPWKNLPSFQTREIQQESLASILGPPEIAKSVFSSEYVPACEQPEIRTPNYRVHRPTVIHSSLRGVNKRGEWILAQGHLIGDGGFARVIAVNRNVAMKATCCPATQKLLSSLTERNAATPGLPRVFQKLGKVGVDADHIYFEGYYLERLFKPVMTKQEALQREVTSYFTAALEEDVTQSNRQLSIEIAQECIRTDRFSLGAAFSKILPVLKALPSVLDLARPGNILFSSQGEICLADPISTVF